MADFKMELKTEQMSFLSLLWGTSLLILNVKGYINNEMESKSKISSLRCFSTDINELGYFNFKLFFNKRHLTHGKSEKST